MGNFTISFGNKNTQFTINLSSKYSKLFTNMGTNLKNSVIGQNSIKLSTEEDYKFVVSAFSSLAKGDGNGKDITDNDFKSVKNTKCDAGKVAKNIWHKHEGNEYNYHKGDNGQGVGNTIWLSDSDDDGV